MVAAPGPGSRRRWDKNDMANQRGNGGGLPSAAGTRAKERELGQFVLSKTLGEGTFGEVKLGVHKPTSERVAAKVLEKNRIKTIADVKRVSREIKILKRVRHPNVIALYEVLDTPSTIYFMMEHCDGGELFDYIVRHQRLQEGQACFFFRQLVDGIDYLHQHDVTHRDLKPENLLLQSSADGWRLKIIDFGLSNTHEGGRLLRTACGSPCYAAPEMIAGKSYRGPAADFWSCGVVLFTLVAGFLPFEDPNTSALYKKILSGSYEKPRWLSEDVTHLLSRILDTDPEKRAAVKEIRAHAWYVGAHPPPSRPSAAPSPVVPSRRSDLDDKLLTRAVTLAGSGGGSGKGGGRGPEAGGEQAVTAAAIKAAAEGLLSGRHDPIGTAYHLLLKRNLRERNNMRAVPPAVIGAQDAQNHEQSTAKPRPSVAVGAGIIDAGTGNGDTRGGVHSTARPDRTYGPAPRPPGAVTARTAEVIRSNASYSSSTSSSRSGQQPAARRRKSSTTAPTSEGNSLRLAATAAARGGDSSGSDLARPRPKVERRESRPQSAIVSRTVRSSAAVMAPLQQSSKEAGERPPEAVTKATVTGTADRPVPLLSFRGIARTDARDAAVGDGGGGGNGKPFNSSVFMSQTARATGGGNPVNRAAPAKQRIGSNTHSRRESAGSSSSGGSTGSGSRTTPPRRPLTARAPLRSSAPTPRLSGDFSLARPRGAPISTAGGNRATTVPSPRVARVSPGNGRSFKAVVPLGPGAVVGAPTTTTTTLSVAKPRGDGGEQAVVVSAPPRPTAQQPSLRVRLSTLSAKVPQRRRESGGDEASVATAGVPAPADAADKSGKISRPPPRRPSASSTASSAAEAAEVSPAGGVKAGRAFWGKLSSPGDPPGGLRVPHASAKGWARGAPAVFRSMNSAGPAAVPARGAVPVGGGQDSSAGA